MNWIKKVLRVGEKIKTNLKKKFPTKSEQESSDWASLECCMKGPIQKKDLEKNLYVCPYCNSHKRISCTQRFDYFFGKDNYQILDYANPAPDPIGFPGYKDKLKDAIKKTGQKSAFMICAGKVNNINVTAIASNFSFIGGSLGQHETEAFLVAIQHAISNRNPVLNFTSGGGIRVQENLIGLSGMSRTTLAVNELKKNNLVYLNVLCDPTAGGQAASYAMLGDLNLAEPGATVAFAGARVIKSTVKEELPPGFQQSEYVKETGFIDLIVERSKLKEKIGSLLSILLKKNSDINTELSDETSEPNIETREAS